MGKQRDNETFCRVYLQTMDPERAAAAVGRGDGFAALGTEAVRARLERMRGWAAGQVQREDAVRRLAQLAFGRANDAVKLALHAGEVDPETLDLSAVSEFRVTDKGGVEVKLVDRVRALETLCGLLERCGGDEAEALYRALEDGGEGEQGYGSDSALLP